MDNSDPRRQSAAIPDSLPSPSDNVPATAAERLRRRAEAETVSDHPAAWMPEVGDELIGTFRGLSSGPTRRGETHQIALVDDDSGNRFGVWLFYRVLEQQFSRAAPEPGDTILFRRRADRTNEAGKEYRDFLVLVESQHPTPDPQTDWTFANPEQGGR